MDHPNVSQGQHIYFRCMAPTAMIYGKCYIWFIIMKSCGHTPFLQKKYALHADLPKAIRGKNIRNAARYRQSYKDGNQHDLFEIVCVPISFCLFQIDLFIDQGGFHFLAVLIGFGFPFLFSTPSHVLYLPHLENENSVIICSALCRSKLE